MNKIRKVINSFGEVYPTQEGIKLCHEAAEELAQIQAVINAAQEFLRVYNEIMPCGLKDYWTDEASKVLDSTLQELATKNTKGWFCTNCGNTEKIVRAGVEQCDACGRPAYYLITK